MNKIRLSLLWQDKLIVASKRLFLQRSMVSLLGEIKAVCDGTIDLQRIYLFLPQLATHRIECHSLKIDDGTTTIAQLQLDAHDAARIRFCSSASAFRYNKAQFMHAWPEFAGRGLFRNLSDCCHLPLVSDRNVIGAIEFIKTDGTTFSAEADAFFDCLAAVIAPAVENLLDIRAMNGEIETLRLQRNHFSILVDATNTAISTLEIKDMVDDVASIIHRFFGLNFIALAINKPFQQNMMRLYSASYREHDHADFDFRLIDHRNTLLEKCTRTGKPLLLKNEAFVQAVATSDPALALARTDLLQSLLILPMEFSQRVYGAMLLGHPNAAIFSESTIELLTQIASRVAIAVHNGLDYEKIAEEKEELLSDNIYMARQIQRSAQSGEIIGNSPALRSVLEQLRMVAHSDSSVLILGETGTGKELFARAIHLNSPRHGKRMVKINCAAMPAALLESELFGHEKGAFTGASNLRKGRFELADGSSLLLDEVGDIPLELQPKLLRVLQEHEIERLGGSKAIPVDVRLIAATNRNLHKMVEDRSYRADLFYRLNVFPLVIPPLRERREDIPLLAHYFMRKFAQRMKRDITHIGADTLRQLCNHHWPGNIRELANVIERAVILSTANTLRLPTATIHLQDELLPTSAVSPARPTPATPVSNAAPRSAPPPVAQNASPSEVDRIIKALRDSNGVVAGTRGAAAKLGLKRTTLLSRMQKLGISAKSVLQDTTPANDDGCLC